ncbi:heme-binding protein [Bdellovibrio bacteriovorus]|uniref:GlcG/HbpS family heme-binding protein n=1 Tax=Bdellovibrio bacteriovorus TaxID=959 RepID=UPI0035A72907
MNKSYALLITTLFSVGANAATVDEKNITMDAALIISQAAVENCASKGYAVAATVVDASGDTKVTLRNEAAGPHTLDASRRKAYTSASAKQPTSAMLATSQSNPTAQNLGQIDGFLLLGGGIPIRINNIVVGAIGVGGAPGGPLDDQCAQAGIDKLNQKGAP